MWIGPVAAQLDYFFRNCRLVLYKYYKKVYFTSKIVKISKRIAKAIKHSLTEINMFIY
ncbi:hypothetical protein DFO73_11017 [Cytobacillus oceanisediminis]|uniref:Uncharacterized protein n=1 Tax=Cytobacillus oceanisediminis TaxID=665099 RepID=A0A2V2ZSZ7_9BACI|nr:hypothetical protein DFO73_11017 [Cytobacillus oceanisediminis]